MREIETEILAMCDVPSSDAEKFVKWMTPEQREKTNFDKNVIGYPRACMARVQQFQKTIAMVPFHPVLMLESLVQDAKLTDSQLVLALNSIDKKIQQVMQDTGMAEVFFQTSSPRFAYICKRHGWVVEMEDPIKNIWLLKKRADIDWGKLLEKHDAANDQSYSESADDEVAAMPDV